MATIHHMPPRTPSPRQQTVPLSSVIAAALIAGFTPDQLDRYGDRELAAAMRALPLKAAR